MNQAENLTLFKQFDISTADTDMFARQRMSSLANMLIQSAIASADSLGFGFDGLKVQKLIWVLSQLTIEIYKPLLWYDTAVVETWPKDISRLFYLRDFIVRNQHNEVVAKATSAWLAIDIEWRRPKIIDGLQAHLFTNLKNKKALDQLPEKLLPVTVGEQSSCIPTFYDIDINKHVTAVRYIDWMMDTFSYEFHKENYPKSFSINYLKETLPHESLEIVKESRANEYNFEGTNQTNQMKTFRGKINF